MPIQMKPTSQIKARLGIQNGGPIHAFFTATCAKAMDKYVPFDEGTLAETVIFEGQPTKNVTVDTITYETNYAKTVYYGVRNGKTLNYHTDKHELAGPYWDKRMWSAQKDSIVKQVQKEVERRGGK